MNYQFFHGTDKSPFDISDDDEITGGERVPFHGIVSRGLLKRFMEHHLDLKTWHLYSHRLFDEGYANDLIAFQDIKKHAKECKMLSFGQSALCVKRYVADFCAENDINKGSIEIWSIKEGHTSSVWKITMIQGDTSSEFVVNVARDMEAGLELKESSEKLKKIGDHDHEINLAKVLDIRNVHLNELLPDVIVTKNEWIANSFEIHERTNKKSQQRELLLVNRFITSSNNPANITSILGRRFSKSETNRIGRDINHFIKTAATCLSIPPGITINDGDVVWNGKSAIIVAIN
jgi:hypothetical protein